MGASEGGSGVDVVRRLLCDRAWARQRRGCQSRLSGGWRWPAKLIKADRPVRWAASRLAGRATRSGGSTGG